METKIVETNKLVPFKNREYYFDDIEGEKWESFKESIKTNGVINPVIITASNLIISGHQRVKACLELRIDKIEAVICDDVKSHDDLLLYYIETNLKQRGTGNPNPIKMGRCIQELERLYGIYHGNHMSNTKKKSKISADTPANQTELANRMGVSVDTLQNYKKLAKMPEIEDAIKHGIITPSFALKYLSKLSKDEREKIINIKKNNYNFYNNIENNIVAISDDELQKKYRNDIINAKRELLKICSKYPHIKELGNIRTMINRL